jgi:1-deoxy-D-xylulose-5-phosphate reductoisomerase
MDPLRVIILGSTGSIGTQTVEVIHHLNALPPSAGPTRPIQVVGLAAGNSETQVLEQARQLGVTNLAIARDGPARLDGRTIHRGPDAAEQLVREVPCDLVVAAMVGFAGLPATLAAVELGRHVALANKETLVAAGGLVVPLAQRTGATLLPVDSEHSGVWQCLTSACGLGASAGSDRASGSAVPPFSCGSAISKIILTASGGPFRTWTHDQIRAATVEQALKHPTWTMGPKVTIDSASLMNKALELIEAHWLFGVEASRLSVLVHPQSIVHALVEFADGSVVAQLGAPDMKTPIQLALTWPHRPKGCSKRLEFATLSRLDFEPPDLHRFPALGWAVDAMSKGGTAGAILNAANEVAVQAFLPGGATRLTRFCDVTDAVARAIGDVAVTPLRSFDDCILADRAARDAVMRRLQ